MSLEKHSVENNKNQLFLNHVSALEKLCQGFFENPNNQVKCTTLEIIFKNSLVFLYRLLFVLNLEIKGILPLNDDQYYSDYSLQKICEERKDQIVEHTPLSTTCWQKLQNLFRLLNGDDPSLNNTLNVAKYGGRLFSDRNYPFLKENELTDQLLCQVLEKISQYSDKRLIDYSSLEFYQLGGFYDQFLELQPRLDKESKKIFLESNRKDRKISGSYYSPVSIVNYMNKNCLQSTFERKEDLARVNNEIDYEQYLIEILSLKVLDPAMGSGCFLVDFTRQVASELVRITPNLSEGKNSQIKAYSKERLFAHWVKKVFENCIYGVDINSMAVELAKAALWLLIAPLNRDLPRLDHNLKLGNSLVGAIEEDIRDEFEDNDLVLDSAKGFVWKTEFPSVFEGASPGFDIVVGNPPYRSFGLGRVTKLNSRTEKYLRKHFPQTAEYKVSIYALFVEKGVSLIKKNGLLSFVLPDSYLTGRYYSKLRFFLLNKTIEKFILFSRDFWSGGDVGFPTVILIRNNAPDPSHQIEWKILKDPKDLLNDLDPNFIIQSSLLNNKRYRFRFIPEQINETIKKMETLSTKFGDFLEFHHGIRSRTGVGKKKIVSNTKNSDAWKSALIQSNEIDQFRIKKPENFINVSPDLLFSGGWNKKHIERPKILIRRTGDRIIAALDKNNLYHTNALIYAIPKRQEVNNNKIGQKTKRIPSKSTNWLLFYLAILNSTIINYYYEWTSMKKGRVFPQMEIDFLEEIPSPFQADLGEVKIEIPNRIYNLGETEKIELIDNLTNDQIFVLVSKLAQEIEDLLLKTSKDDPLGSFMPESKLNQDKETIKRSIQVRKMILDQIISRRLYKIHSKL